MTIAGLQGVRILDFACDTAMDLAEEPLAVWSSIQVCLASVKASVQDGLTVGTFAAGSSCTGHEYPTHASLPAGGEKRWHSCPGPRHRAAPRAEPAVTACTVLQQAEVAGGKRVKFLAWALFQTAVLGNWLRNSNVPLLRSLLSWPRSLLSRESERRRSVIECCRIRAVSEGHALCTAQHVCMVAVHCSAALTICIW
jgi:hypothetical protein